MSVYSDLVKRELGAESSYARGYMTREQGVLEKHQEWTRDAKELVGYQEPPEDAQTAAPTIPDSSPSQQ